MSVKLLLPGLLLITLLAASCTNQGPSEVRTRSATATQAEPAGHDHTSARVPAFQTVAADLDNLPSTLPPEQFLGKAREAYKAVREIPQTIAQLPCYCYCDEGHGHKSLHSCFEDNHASQCAVCVDEALMAYRLEKGQKMTAPKIRELVVAKYSAQQ